MMKCRIDYMLDLNRNVNEVHARTRGSYLDKYSCFLFVCFFFGNLHHVKI